MKKILIIKLGALGDVIFAEGAIRDIQNHHPHAEITLLTTPFFKRILAEHPSIDRIEIDTRRPRWNLWYLYQLIRKLRRHRYDMVYDLQNNRRTNLYHKLMMPILWSGKAWLASSRYVQHDTSDKHRHNDLEAQLQLAGISTQYCRTPNWIWLKAPIDHILKAHHIDHPFILMLPGCSKRHPQKRWPGYSELARLLKQRGHTIVCAPGPDEMDLVDTFPGICLLDQNKPLSIHQLVGLSQHAQLVIGNDSGPTHLLARCHTKGIAIFQKAMYVSNSGIGNYYDVFQHDPIQQITVDSILQRVMTRVSPVAADTANPT